MSSWLDREYDVRTVLDLTYPRNLRVAGNRPPLLFVVGCWREDVDGRAVAVVGARNASPIGLRRAARVARDLVRGGYTVVSGLARGVDAAAHIAALDAGGRTAAVMGTGIERRYPAANRVLADRIVASGGALLSRFLPQQPPTVWTFPHRNVVTAGLSLAIVIVEAGAISGTRRMAYDALRQGRAVFLLRSLVRSQTWAAACVRDGVDGARAIELESTAQLVDRLHGAGGPPSHPLPP
ncbi:MAG: hypothetical protein NVS4B3_25320 [Gemmatimonadaceae bacterium]